MKNKILIADDEEFLVELLKDTLTEEGYEVITAHNGNTALEKIQKEKPDLVLLDVMMPGIDGYDITYYVSLETGYKPKIIMLTARDKSWDQDMGKAMGAHVYLTKPFDLNDVRAKVKELLAGS